MKQQNPHWQESQSVTYSDEDSCCVFMIPSLSWFQDKCDTIPKCNSITAVDDKPHDTSSQTREYASFDTCSFGWTQFFCISVNIMFRIKTFSVKRRQQFYFNITDIAQSHPVYLSGHRCLTKRHSSSKSKHMMFWYRKFIGLLKVNWNETCKHCKITANWVNDVGGANCESVFK